MKLKKEKSKIGLIQRILNNSKKKDLLELKGKIFFTDNYDYKSMRK